MGVVTVLLATDRGVFGEQPQVALAERGQPGEDLKGVAVAQGDPAVVQFASYVNDERAAREVVTAISDAGGKAVRIKADLSRRIEVRRLFDEAEAAFGRLGVVVANAATALVKPVVECAEEEFDTVFDRWITGQNLNATGGVI
ncbi:SDR family oxidoreductase [Nonomuraea angiospora]|uniref:SDR family oxidoreductase n=1 Tax=Nonomuraea angiospora TaxID=46172 RepID=UPI0037BB1087